MKIIKINLELRSVLMKIKILIPVFLMITSVLSVQAQTQKSLESLESSVIKLEGKEKVDTLNRLSFLYKDFDTKKSSDYAEEARTLANKIGYREGFADALVNINLGMPRTPFEFSSEMNYREAYKIFKELGKRKKEAETLLRLAYYNFERHEINKAYQGLLESFSIFESLGDKSGKALCYLYYSRIYERIQYFDIALEFSNLSYSLYREVDDKKGMADNLVQSAVLYIRSMKNVQQIMPNLLKAEKYYKEIEAYSALSDVYRYLSSYYIDVDPNFRKAISYIELGIKNAFFYKNMLVYSSVLTHKGFLYAKLKNDYETDLKCNLEALAIRKKHDFLLTVSSSYLNIGYDLIKLKRYAEADTNIQTGLQMALKARSLVFIRRAYLMLYELNETSGNLTDAIKYLKLHQVYTDSIYVEESKSKVQMMQELSLSLQKDKKILELENKEGRTMLIYLVIFSGLVLIASVAFYLLYLGKKKDNLLLQKQKEEIENREELIYHLNENNPLPIFIIDITEWKMIYQNNSLVKYFGTKAFEPNREINIEGLLNYIHDEDRDYIERLLSTEYFVDELQSGFTLRIMNVEKKWNWVFIRGIVFHRSESGAPKTILGFLVDISQQKENEYRIIQKSENLKAINEFAIKISSIDQNEDIHKVIADWLKQMSKAVAVSVSSYNSAESYMQIRYISTDNWLLEKVNKIINSNIYELKMPVSNNTRQEMLEDVVMTSNDFSMLTFGEISNTLGKLIQQTLGIKEFKALSLAFGNLLYGSVVVFLSKDSVNLDEGILKIFASLASVAVRKRLAEEELVLSEQRYRELIDNSLVGIMISDKNRLQYCNNRLAEIFGYSTYKDIIDKDVTFLVKESDRREFISYVSMIQFNKSQDSLRQFTGLRKDGSTAYLNVLCNRINYFGKPSLQFIVLDISEKRMAEQALNEKEIQYKTVIETSPDGIIVLDMPGNILTYNKKTAEMMGYHDNDDLTGINIFDLISPGSTYSGKYSADSIGDLKKNFKMEYTFLRKDRTTFIGELNTGLVFNTDGNPGSIIGVIRDVTDRKKAEEMVKDSEMILRTFLDALPEAACLIDTQYKLVACNEKFIDNIGATGRIIIGESLLDLIPIGLLMKLKSNIDLAIRTREPLSYEDNSKSNYYICFLNPVIGNDNNIKGITFLFIDITDRKKSESALQNMSRLQSIGTLAGGIAHNFKNMLTSMLLNVGLAKAKPEKSEKYLNNIHKAIEQANALATRFQTFSVGGDVIRETVNINRIIDDSISVALSGYSVVCKTDYYAKDLYVDADPKQMNEVFTNLLMNAVQAMPFGGSIHVVSDRINLDEMNSYRLSAGDYARVAFKDEGVGIEEENLTKIFDPFFTTKSDGNGLGLSSAYYILQNHKGRIIVRSEVNKGTEFIVFIPATKEAAQTEEDEAEALYYGNGERILIMDDDADIRDSLADILSILNYETVFAVDGDEAVEVYRQNLAAGQTFSAVILDLTIKGGEGGEMVLKMLREIDPEIVAIVFSGHSATPVLSNFRDYGFRECLMKPVTLHEISSVLKKVIEQ